MAAQPSTWRGRSEQIALDQVGCEARKIPAEGDVFFLDFSPYRTYQELGHPHRMSGPHLNEFHLVAIGCILWSLNIANITIPNEIANVKTAMKKEWSVPVWLIVRAENSPARPVHQ
jgi:hypothetical protein